MLPVTAALAVASAMASAVPPAFTDFPAALRRVTAVSEPHFRTLQQRKYRGVLHDATAHGYGVITGGTEHERPGINFGGHYLLVQWSCGIACRQAALIDAQSGNVLPLPGNSGQPSSDFVIFTGSTSVDLRDLQFRADSRLLGILDFGAGKTNYYALSGRAWKFVGACVSDASALPRASRPDGVQP